MTKRTAEKMGWKIIGFGVNEFSESPRTSEAISEIALGQPSAPEILRLSENDNLIQITNENTTQSGTSYIPADPLSFYPRSLTLPLQWK